MLLYIFTYEKKCKYKKRRDIYFSIAGDDIFNEIDKTDNSKYASSTLNWL